MSLGRLLQRGHRLTNKDRVKTVAKIFLLEPLVVPRRGFRRKWVRFFESVSGGMASFFPNGELGTARPLTAQPSSPPVRFRIDEKYWQSGFVDDQLDGGALQLTVTNPRNIAGPHSVNNLTC